MSIIEKAMKKLNGAREKPKQPVIAERPNVVTHPTIVRTSGQKQTAQPVAARPNETGLNERPVARLQTEGFQSLDYQTPQVAEELRRIKRPLLANAYGKSVVRVERGNLIMLTSSIPGEGKSRMALNLAYSMALERNHSVLLVDADAAKAQTSRTFGLDRAAGLTDVLLKRGRDLNDVICRADTPSVSVVPAGRGHVQAAELLGSDEMEQLVIGLGEADPHRLVIFDCPPLLATNEPQLISRLVGQIVVVVEAGRTPQHVVKEAISMLDPTKAIGLVLNKSRNTIGGDYYGYSYSYGGYYGGYGEDGRHPMGGNADR